MGGELEGRSRPLHCECDEGWRDSPQGAEDGRIVTARGSMVVSPELRRKREQPTESILQALGRIGSSLGRAYPVGEWVEESREVAWNLLGVVHFSGCFPALRRTPETSHLPKSDRTRCPESGLHGCHSEPDPRSKRSLHTRKESV